MVIEIFNGLVRETEIKTGGLFDEEFSGMSRKLVNHFLRIVISCLSFRRL